MAHKRAPSLAPSQVTDAVARARERAVSQGLASPVSVSPPIVGVDSVLDCPSVPSNRPGARAFAVAGGPVLEYLQQPVEVSAELLEQAGPVRPTQIVRFASPCEEGHCPNFGNSMCQLGRRVVSQLPAVVDGLPACRIRGSCRWFAEQGREVCLRCPQIVTEQVNPTALQRSVAQGPRQFLSLLLRVY